MPYKICKGLFVALMLFILSSGRNMAWSQEQPAPETAKPAETHESSPERAEAFNPGDFIFDHIKDAYVWHISGHISIPLPVIVYSKNNGFHVFMANKFQHGHTDYNGFRIATSGIRKGRIVDIAGGFVLDLSITKNIAALLVGFGLILLIFLTLGKAYRKNPIGAPSGLQTWVEPIIIFLRDDVIKPSVGPRYEQYTPYLLTLFFFIWINNMLGLIPIPPFGANLTGNIAVTMVLALFTFFITNISANRNYWKHTLNTPGVPAWLKLPIPIMPLVEVLGVFTKPLVLMIRLFANITAGHIVVMGFITLIYIFAQMSAGLAYGVSLISIAFNVFITFLELLVAFIQAFIFTFLSSIYIGLAIAEDHHHEEKKEHA
jgi:F-type H+-transporting ATPase subunit a